MELVCCEMVRHVSTCHHYMPLANRGEFLGF